MLEWAPSVHSCFHVPTSIFWAHTVAWSLGSWGVQVSDSHCGRRRWSSGALVMGFGVEGLIDAVGFALGWLFWSGCFVFGAWFGSFFWSITRDIKSMMLFEENSLGPYYCLEALSPCAFFVRTVHFSRAPGSAGVSVAWLSEGCKKRIGSISMAFQSTFSSTCLTQIFLFAFCLDSFWVDGSWWSYFPRLAFFASATG